MEGTPKNLKECFEELRNSLSKDGEVEYSSTEKSQIQVNKSNSTERMTVVDRMQKRSENTQRDIRQMSNTNSLDSATNRKIVQCEKELFMNVTSIPLAKA